MLDDKMISITLRVLNDTKLKDIATENNCSSENIRYIIAKVIFYKCKSLYNKISKTDKWIYPLKLKDLKENKTEIINRLTK